MRSCWINYGKIVLRSSKQLPKSQITALQNAVLQNRIFFGFALAPIKITVCHSAEEWKTFCRYHHFAFARGVVLRDGSIVLKSPKLAERNLRAWQKIAAHEINHCYWRAFNKSRSDLWSPIWLVEGLACFVAKNDIVTSQKNLMKLFKKYPP